MGPQFIYTTADVQSVRWLYYLSLRNVCIKRWILFQRPTNISFKVMKKNDNDKNKSEIMGSATVASFQLLRYVRRHEYIEIPMLHGSSYKYTSAPNNLCAEDNIHHEVEPGVCVIFASYLFANILLMCYVEKLVENLHNVFGLEKYVWQCIAEKFG